MTARAVALLRPRVGLPSLIAPATPFVVETLERWDEPLTELCLTRFDERITLALVDEWRHDEGDGRVRVRRTLVPTTAPRPGAWTLQASPALRASRAVWIVDAVDPDAPRRLRVAHLTDLHVGLTPAVDERLAEVINHLNDLEPDLVLVTGDIVDNGDRAAHFVHARELLARIAAPTFVVPGNHDHGFSLRALAGGVGRGWLHFAQAFHSWRHFAFSTRRRRREQHYGSGDKISAPASRCSSSAVDHRS